MKFNKTKALVALSITLLLSTQTKPMGHDAELALQVPMAQASVEVVNPTLTQQAVNAFSKAKNVTMVNGKELAGKALKAGKSAAQCVAANAGKAAGFVAAHTPEFVTNAASYIENNELQVPVIIGAGLVGYGAYKAYTPTKNAIKNAISNPKVKVALALAPVVGVAGVAVYQNKEAISNMAKEVVNSISNGASAVKNADYAKYGQAAVDAVKPVGEFAAKQFGKLKVNGARLVEAAKNVDIKGMAKNSKEFVANHNFAFGVAAATPAVLGAGYAIDKHVMPKLKTLEERKAAKKLAARIANSGDVVAIAYPESVISADSVTVTVDHSPVTQAELDAIIAPLNKVSPAQLSARAVAKPAPAQKRAVEQTILPGQVA